MTICIPPYAYRPTFLDNHVDCSLDVYEETRARSPVGLGGTFFRSKGAGEAQNLISLEMTYTGGVYYLHVYDDGVEVELFAKGGQGAPIDDGSGYDVCTPNLIDDFRTIVNVGSGGQGPSAYIEMPTLDYGGVHSSSATTPLFDATDKTHEAGCLSTFTQTSLSGGTGGPSSGPSIVGGDSVPRTGPQRSVIAVMLTELEGNTHDYTDQGIKYEPITFGTSPTRQWDGSAWIEYIPPDCAP